MRDLIAEAYDTADFIRSHVVQAAENEQGNYCECSHGKIRYEKSATASDPPNPQTIRPHAR